MRKLLLLICIIIFAYSCNNMQNNRTSSSKNTELKSDTDYLVFFFKSYKEKGYKSPNEIAKRELIKEREKEITKLIDSLIILKNIKGEISEIAIHESSSKKQKVLTYNIKVGREESFYISLECSHLIENEEDDYFYNKIKNYYNHQDVYFDGIISIDIKKNLPKEHWSTDKTLTLSYPKYYFHVIDISSQSLSDTTDMDFNNTIKLGKDCMDCLSLKFRNEKYDEKSFKNKSDKFNKHKSNLAENKKYYIQRYMEARALDFVN